MSDIPYSQEQFDANHPPPPLGRGRRDAQFNSARQELENTRLKHKESAQKRAATIAGKRNPTADNSQSPQTTTAGRTPPTPMSGVQQTAVQQTHPAPLLQQRPGLTSTKAPGSLTTMPQTPRMPLRPVDNSTPLYADFSRMSTSGRPSLMATRPSTQTTPRTALQPVNDSSPTGYADFSGMAGSQSFMSTPPSTQTNLGADWFASLDSSTRDAIFKSMNTPMIIASSAGDSDQNLGGNPGYSSRVPELESFGGQDIGSDMDDNDSRLYGDREQPWGQVLDEGPQDSPAPPPTSSLNITMRSVAPAYQQRKNRRTVPQTNTEDNDGEEDAEDESEAPAEPAKKKQKSRSIADLDAEHQDICNSGYHYVKIEVTLRTPFPVGIGRKRGGTRTAVAHADQFSELILGAFTDAAFDLGLEDVTPRPADIALLRARVPQFRSGLKTVCRGFVPAAYGLVDIKTLKKPTPALIAATEAKNRARVHQLLGTFIYGDPDKISPETMFLHDIFQCVLTAYWFGTGDNDRTFYFQGQTQIELPTFALIIVAVQCAIEEWSTGRRANKDFSHISHFRAYKAVLSGVKKWMAHSEEEVERGVAASNATTDELERLLRDARTASHKPEEGPQNDDDDDLFSLDAMFTLSTAAAA
ncbi:hypothetical protein B0H16DRAFT_1800268 [Mycena metata]|uniref:DUF6532 domain-containing protein n=1 Tax=Mycena metata TaxID=1033252 RepID=A0AAD7HBY1_9AGAR|nr:hypothetical protein B0H16DRAFT_1800268 [Mycena metata]